MSKKGKVTARAYVEGGITKRALAAIRREFVQRAKSERKVSSAELVSLEYDKITTLRKTYNFRQIGDYYRDKFDLLEAPNSRTLATAYAKFEKAIRIEKHRVKRRNEVLDSLK